MSSAGKIKCCRAIKRPRSRGALPRAYAPADRQARARRPPRLSRRRRGKSIPPAGVMPSFCRVGCRRLSNSAAAMPPRMRGSAAGASARQAHQAALRSGEAETAIPFAVMLARGASQAAPFCRRLDRGRQSRPLWQHFSRAFCAEEVAGDKCRGLKCEAKVAVGR